MKPTRQRLVPLDETRRDHLGGIGRTKLYDLIDEKKLVRVCIGRRAFITADSIDAYLASLIQEATGAGKEILAAQRD